jgi:hypothetical protein
MAIHCLAAIGTATAGLGAFAPVLLTAPILGLTTARGALYAGAIDAFKRTHFAGFATSLSHFIYL